MPPSIRPPGWCAADPVLAAIDLVVRRGTAPPGGGKPVADLDSLDRVDAHQGSRQPAVQPPVPVHVAAQARRQPVADDLDHAAERVPVLAGLVDLDLHGGAGRGIQAADRIAVHPGGVLRPGRIPSGALIVPMDTT